MGEPIETEYFNWLCAKTNPQDHYERLLRGLHETTFAWLVVGDDNRAADGVELRSDFLNERDLHDEELMTSPCSVLEMLVAFSARASFMTDIPDREWFWEFIYNLGLSELTDDTGVTPRQVAQLLEPFIWRNYDQDGRNGGMFPLHTTHKDQRDVELWYQFCDYLEDQHRMP